MEKFQQALQHLLPTGYAWPRDPNSVLMKLLAGVAASLDDLESLTGSTTMEWLPHATNVRLAEWEAATRLPDDCFGSSQTVAARRSRLLSRLRGPSGVYADSSPASLYAIDAICSNLRIPGVARYNHPFRCGRDRIGRRIGVLDGKLQLIISAASEPFRVSRNRVADRLSDRPPGSVQLACYLEQYVPARYELVVTFTP